MYIGLQEGKAAYVGITNDFLRRVNEWGGTYILEKITTEKVTKDMARAIEQTVIEANSEFKNAINSIAKSREWYGEAIKRGKDWLKSNGVGDGLGF